MSEAMHSNPLWAFCDVRGVAGIGHVERVTDFGGTDQTMVLRDCATDELCLVSGSRLRSGNRLWHACEKSGS